jgi:uncharacterized protein (TIGR00645 family)
MQNYLFQVGKFMFALRGIMSLFYLGLIVVIGFVLYRFGVEVFHIFDPGASHMSKMDLIIKVLELVDMTMVAQLVWVVALAGFSLFVTAGHFEGVAEKPDWLDHVNTYNLKLKLAFAIISISGVHALKTYLKGEGSTADIMGVAGIHLLFVLSAVGIAYAEKLTHSKDHR